MRIGARACVCAWCACERVCVRLTASVRIACLGSRHGAKQDSPKPTRPLLCPLLPPLPAAGRPPPVLPPGHHHRLAGLHRRAPHRDQSQDGQCCGISVRGLPGTNVHACVRLQVAPCGQLQRLPTRLETACRMCCCCACRPLTLFCAEIHRTVDRLKTQTPNRKHAPRRTSSARSLLCLCLHDLAFRFRVDHLRNAAIS